MALTSRTPTTLVTNLFVPAIYSNKVIEAAKSQLVAFDCINSEWASGMKKGNIFYIPKTNVVSATEVVVGTKASATNPMATTGITLTINQWYEAPVDIEDMSAFQTQTAAEDYASTEAAYAVNVKMDTSVCTLFTALSSSSIQGADGQTMTDDILLAVKEGLDEANVPMDGKRYLIVDPSALTDMMKIDKFIQNDYVNKGAVTNGIIGNSPIYGCQVRVTNNLVAATTGAYAAMLHKNALAAKAQIHKAWTSEYKELHQTRYQAEALWGVIEAQTTFGKCFYTRHA